MVASSVVKFSELAADIRLDAEYYRPHFLKQAAAVLRLPHKRIIDLAKVSDGNHLTIAEHFVDEGVRYLRGQDLSDFFISDADPLFIPEKNYTELTRSHMFPGDVLVSIVGTIGSVGLVTDRHGKLTGSCKLAIIRPHTLPAEYVAAYLASRPGQNEIERRIRGAVQMGLILPDIKGIPVPIPDNALLKRVVGFVRGSQAARASAVKHYAEAEALLLSSLGLDGLDLSPKLFYVRSHADTLAAGRLGAEYFQPPKQRVLDALRKMPGKPLADHFRAVRDLYQPNDAPATEMVRNFDLTDALQPFIGDTTAPVEGRSLGSTKKRFQAGDVVVSRLRSYLKEIAVVRASSTVPCVGSSEFYVFRRKKGGLSAEALTTYLRCPLVQTVLKWCQDGSNHPRFEERELTRLPVPDRLRDVEREITRMVDKAITARREAAKMLEDGKAAVENLILGDGQSNKK